MVGLMFASRISSAARQLHHLITSSASGTDATSQRVLIIGPPWWRAKQTAAPDDATYFVELLYAGRDLSLFAIVLLSFSIPHSRCYNSV